MSDPRPIHTPGVSGFTAWYHPESTHANSFKQGGLKNVYRAPFDIYTTPEAAALAMWLDVDRPDDWAAYLVIEVVCLAWVDIHDRVNCHARVSAVREVGAVGGIVRACLKRAKS